MVKAARVTLVGYEKIGSGRVTVIVRGDVSEVQASVGAGVESVKRVNGGQVLSTHIIARPHENSGICSPHSLYRRCRTIPGRC